MLAMVCFQHFQVEAPSTDRYRYMRSIHSALVTKLCWQMEVLLSWCSVGGLLESVQSGIENECAPGACASIFAPL